MGSVVTCRPHVLRSIWRLKNQNAAHPLCKLRFSTDQEPASRVVEILTEADFKTKMIEDEVSGRLAVLEFTAKWCPPCKFIAPIYNQLSREFQDVHFYKIDIDLPEVQGVAAKFDISSVPTFSFLKAGNKVESLTGADPVQLRTLVDRYK